MSCILKFPDRKSKGVIVFTTPERDNFIHKNKTIADKINHMKDSWIIGLHHNWHDYNFEYKPLFDFSMAGETDLIEKNNSPFKLIPMDACNFAPPVFEPNDNDKFWDILYVARSVSFKKIPEFLKIVKKLYTNEKYYRVAFLCPIPTPEKNDKQEYNVRKDYEQLFTLEESQYFNLFTFEYSYPFPLDMDALAFFYRSSKVFVHTADDERRCRVAAYAWSSGMPVIAMDCVGSLLPDSLRTEPYFYSVTDYDDFPGAIERALKRIDLKDSFAPVIAEFNSVYSIKKLVLELHQAFPELPVERSEYYLQNLDIRLGRHYGLASGSNRIGDDFPGFVSYLADYTDTNAVNFSDDPEIDIASKIEFKKEMAVSTGNSFSNFFQQYMKL